MNLEILGLIGLAVSFWILGWFSAWIAGAFKCLKEEKGILEYLGSEP